MPPGTFACTHALGAAAYRRGSAGGQSRLISTSVLLASTRQADLVTAWEVVRDGFGDHDVPSTLMGVTVLGYDDQLVEIGAVAAVVD